MQTLLRIALGAGGAALAGSLAGFVAAILALASKHWRNGRLVDRGQPGIRDALLPLPFVFMSAFVSLFLGGVLAIFLTPVRAILIGALIPAGLLAVISILGSIWQAYFE